MNCNQEAFAWIIEVTKIKANFSEDKDFEPLSEISIKALLNERF